jgi:indole-3-glycerol phosphate synthase
MTRAHPNGLSHVRSQRACAVQAGVSGADAVLLIAAMLPNVDHAYFLKAARRYGMVCLMEVH